MLISVDKGKDEIIQKVIEMVESKLPKEKATLLSEFISKFYRSVSADDLMTHTITDLYGAAVSFWEFMEQRVPGETKVRCYNPHYETNAWQSTHTIIEVISDDMPFLVDSILMELNRRNLTTHLIINVGGLRVCRDDDNVIVGLYAHSESGGKTCSEEAPVFLEIDRQTDPDVLEDISQSILKVLNDVEIANEDWMTMRDKVNQSIKELESCKAQFSEEEFEESIDFLKWIEDNHFTFLGLRDYELITEGDEIILRLLPNTGLGVLRDTSTSKFSRRIADMTPEAQKLTLSQQPLIISKTNTKSTVHRPTYTDYIGIKRFNENGDVIGERRIIGLYTSAAYNTNPKQIPFLRRKVDKIIKKSQLKPRSHAGKTLLNILVTLPRDDLFQGTTDELIDIAMGIFYLQERKRIRLFARRDIYGRFISALVFVPRDHFNTQLRMMMQKLLEQEFGASESTFSTRFSESILARIHFILRVDPNDPREVDIKALEDKLIDAGRSWEDEFGESILDYYGEEKGNQLTDTYDDAFPSSYKEYYLPRTGLHDLRYIENLSDDNPLELNFFKPIDDLSCEVRLKVYQLENTIPLSDVLPILENMGLRVISERPYEIEIDGTKSAWINDFGMSFNGLVSTDIEAIKETFQDAFSQIWFNRVENDGFNQLVLSAGLSWREIIVLRAYAKYFRQTGFTFSQKYIEQTLASHSEISRCIAKYFITSFDPKENAQRDAQTKAIHEQILKALDDVVSLDEDRILRRYITLMQATLRTNFFQTDENGETKSYLSLKLNPSNIPELPLPKPEFEIFVYSPRFEGVHLRGSNVARGGLRWSDRREDFRTEILGLMKAQQVKNAVIVPSGAKGGFVPKNLPIEGSREAIMEEGIACYQGFIRGLLDITDNLKSGEVIKPDNVICYDEDDPYLVVAADKGTATFSDIANAISQEYNFWLDDAFASGGSVGYDHKKMGITAKGAWESVKRHFRELGVDCQTNDFTCVAIGDMSGDVFGNGMLLSRHNKLVAAFNHMHIFLDPNPNPETSFIERERLFNLPRSSWTDYDETLISKGGGIFSRSAKSIPLSPEVKSLLEIAEDELVPNDLIKAILKAPVDLLWNGGIGTYVKGIHETHTQVGDRSNDNIRLDASELRVKIIGEGGNLGMTQQARVEYALSGGHIYTDFIDNSAGVDCSDHEVNIKILLNQIVANGDLTLKQRNDFLASMTDEVSDLVLAHNYNQTLAISFAAEQAHKHVDLHSRYIESLELSGELDRSLEFLPDRQTLMERKLVGKGLARPGISVLLAYSKISLKNEILDCDLAEDPYFAQFVELGFPEPLRKQYNQQMYDHSLRRQIIATQTSNLLVNEMGFTFIYRLHDETGAPSSAIVRAYTVIRELFNLEALFKDINALDNKISTDAQFEMILTVTRVVRRATRWLLKSRRQQYDIQSVINEFKPGVDELLSIVPDAFIGEDLEKYQSTLNGYIESGVPKKLAVQLTATHTLFTALDIIEVANESKMPIAELAQIYFAIDEYLELGFIRREITKQPISNHWEILTREAMRDDLDWQQRLLSISIIQHKTRASSLDGRIQSWINKYSLLVERWKYMLADLRSASSLNFTMIFVGIRELLDLTQTSMQTSNTKKTKKTEKMRKSA